MVIQRFVHPAGFGEEEGVKERLGRRCQGTDGDKLEVGNMYALVGSTQGFLSLMHRRSWYETNQHARLVVYDSGSRVRSHCSEHD